MRQTEGSAEIQVVELHASTVETRGSVNSRLVNDEAFVKGVESLLLDHVRLKAGQSAVLVYDPEVKAVCRAIGEIAVEAGITVDRVLAALDWTVLLALIEKQSDAVLFLESGRSHHTRALLRYLSDNRTPRAYRMFGATAETLQHGFRRGRSTPPELGSHRKCAPHRPSQSGKRLRHSP